MCWLFRDDQQEKKGLKAKILDATKNLDKVEDANLEMTDDEEQPEDASGQWMDEDEPSNDLASTSMETEDHEKRIPDATK